MGVYEGVLYQACPDGGPRSPAHLGPGSKWPERHNMLIHKALREGDPEKGGLLGWDDPPVCAPLSHTHTRHGPDDDYNPHGGGLSVAQVALSNSPLGWSASEPFP